MVFAIYYSRQVKTSKRAAFPAHTSVLQYLVHFTAKVIMQLVALGFFALILPVQLQVQNPSCGALAPDSCTPTSSKPERSAKFKKYESFNFVRGPSTFGCSNVGQGYRKSGGNSLVKCAASCLGNSLCRSFLYSSDGGCMACTSPAHKLNLIGAASVSGSWSLFELNHPDSTTEPPLA